MCETKVYDGSGGTQKIGTCEGGIDMRFGGSPDPKQYKVKAGVCLQCNTQVKASSEYEAKRKIEELLGKEGMFASEEFEVMFQGIEFIDVVEAKNGENMQTEAPGQAKES